MRTAARSLRSLRRSGFRSALLIAVLAVSMGLALTMLVVDQAFAKRVEEIEANVGTEVTVRPAGSFGGGISIIRQGGDGPGDEVRQAGPQTVSLDQSALESAADQAHVTAVNRRLLQSGPEDGLTMTLSGANIRSAGSEDDDAPAEIRLPAMYIGTDDPNRLVGIGGIASTVSEGRTFNGEDSAEAVMSKKLAEDNDLATGDTFDVNGTTLTLVGLFESGTQFGDNAVFLPLRAAQAIFDKAGEISEATLTVDSSKNVEEVAEAVRDALGADVADVTTDADQYESIRTPVTDARASSRIGLASRSSRVPRWFSLRWDWWCARG